MISYKEEFFREHFDYSDRDTVKFLAEDATQDKMLTALTHRLYEKIQEKYEKLDFSTVSRSRGDITKIEKYDSLVECLDILTKLVGQYNQDSTPVDIINTAMENLKKRTDIFKKAYAVNSPILIMTYNTMTLAIVESVSFMISVCVEYVKTPESETFQMALDTVAYNNTRSNLLFESLAEFNSGCANGEFDKAAAIALSENKYKHEAAKISVKYDNPFENPEDEETDNSEEVIHDDDLLSESLRDYTDMSDYNKYHDNSITPGNIFSSVSRAFLFFTKFLLPAIRNLTYYYYARRQAKSDYYADQAQLIQMNMLQLQSNTTISVDDKKKILSKQEKIYQKYMAKKNKYAIEYNVGKKSVEKMIKDDDKKVTAKSINFDPSISYDPSESILF